MRYPSDDLTPAERERLVSLLREREGELVTAERTLAEGRLELAARRSSFEALR